MAEVANEINATRRPVPYMIAPGDVVEVRFPFRADWDQTVTVRADGAASFLTIGEVATAGLTVARLSERLSEAYRDVVGAGPPTVNVMLTTSGGADRASLHEVFVIGDVQRPGAVSLTGAPLSLIEAIGKAGGPIKETANLRHTLLVRWLPDEGRRVGWRIDAGVEQWPTAPPILLQTHDVVFVPNTPIDDVDIWVDKYIRRLLPFPFFPVQ